MVTDMASKNRLVVKSPNIIPEIRKRIEAAAITVGIHADVGSHKEEPSDDESEGSAGEPVTVAMIYFWNEFGTEPSGKHPGIPERPTLRPTMKKERIKYVQIMAKIAANAMKKQKGLGVKRQMGLLGTVAEADLKKAIVDLKAPPNSETTIAKKKSDNPLIDTGQMLNSIRWAYVNERLNKK